MKKIQKILEESIPQEQVLREARAWRVLKRWPEIVGAALAEKSAPDRYEKGTVWVAVLGSAWSNELRMQKATILNRLHQLSGDTSLFNSLRFGVRKFSYAAVEMQEPKTAAKAPISDESIRERGERLIKKLQDEGRA